MHEFPKMCEPRPFSVDEECALDELRRLFATRSDIEFQSDNYFLTKFLRFCDWNPQRAFASCVNYYEMKHMNPTYCASKNVSEYMDLLNLNSRVILDKRDKCGRAILVSKLGNIGPPMQFTDSAILDDIYLEILLSDPLTQINGITIIADCKGLKSSILKWLVPKNNKIGASKLESFPVKEWTIHMINMGPILKACIMLVKPFLRKQTIERFHIHSNGLNELHEILGTECLPEEYGGTNGPIDYEKSLKLILAHEKMLERNRCYGVKTTTTETP